MRSTPFTIALLISFYLIPSKMTAQNLDSLLIMNMQGEETIEPAIYRSSTIVNSHSVTLHYSGTLDFRIEHRFGQLNTGVYELWGLDNAEIHFSFEYGIFDWLLVGAGRGTYEKTYDAFFRVRPLTQAKGTENFPFSLAWQSGIYVNTLRYIADFDGYRFNQRMEHVHQVMIARKFGELFSVQLMPSYLRRTPIPALPEQTDLLAMGTGFSFEITSSFSLNVEYFHLLNNDVSLNPAQLYNPLSFGFDLETGGHIFQLIFTNSLAMTEHGIIGNTNGSWMDGDIHFGFNISRIFGLK
ncbi:MAG: DUF5777 family beta-barrel protein [Bacteroidales bacterium]